MTAQRSDVRRTRRLDQPGRLLMVNLTACLVLLVQYLLGMAVNLFVVIPSHHPGARAANYFTGAVSGLAWIISRGPGWAAAHAALGLLLALAALASIALTWRKDSRFLAATTVLGGLAVIGAGFNGLSFINYGHNFSSMIMAGLWALAVACYVVGAFIAARQLRQSR